MAPKERKGCATCTYLDLDLDMEPCTICRFPAFLKWRPRDGIEFQPCDYDCGHPSCEADRTKSCSCVDCLFVAGQSKEKP